MKKFKFELETLLKIRERKAESVKEQLAKKNTEIQDQQRTFDLMQNELKLFQEDQKLRRGTETSVLGLRYSVNYRNKLKMDLLDCGKNIQVLQKDVYLITQELVKATQERKTIEILKEKRFVEWKKNRDIIEQQLNDEMSGQRYIRKKKGATDVSA